ncbi:MAG: hypothetical protein QXJ45_06900 [Thermoproteota archaeon]
MSEYEYRNVKVRILEAIPINVMGKRSYLLSLQIEDGDYVTPVIRKEIKQNESLHRILMEFVDVYLETRDLLKRWSK